MANNNMRTIEFDDLLFEKYGGRGPRYTSYPTAVQFRPDFDEAKYREVALQSNEEPIPRSLSLYLHIPFCETLCYYCACNKFITRHRDTAVRYLDYLITEIRMQGELYDHDRVVEQLHFGGGTPTYLSTDQISMLMEVMRENFQFGEFSDREFSIEIDPRTVDAKILADLVAMGINRLSMGVQDFDPRVQKAVNRIQPKEETAALIQSARECGFRSISLDLIYGLPLQTVSSFEKTLDQVVDIRPDRISVYSYAHLPQAFKSQRLIKSEDLPDAKEKLAIFASTVKKLCDAGYVYIGMDHFALPDNELVQAMREGRLQRNFQGYSTRAGCDLIGMGVSAISSIGAAYSQHVKSTRAYCGLLAEPSLPVERGIMLTTDDRIRRFVIQRLMCQQELIKRDVEHAFAIDFDRYFAYELISLVDLENDGLVEILPDRIVVTSRGKLLLRPVAMQFDAYVRRTNPASGNGAITENRFSRLI